MQVYVGRLDWSLLRSIVQSVLSVYEKRACVLSLYKPEVKMHRHKSNDHDNMRVCKLASWLNSGGWLACDEACGGFQLDACGNRAEAQSAECG